MQFIAPTKYVEDGYGNSTTDLYNALERAGAIFDGTGHTIVYGSPERAPEANYGVYTMWETDRPPIEWKEKLQKADWVANPSAWGTKVFSEYYGIDVHHVPLAYSDEFQLIHRGGNDVFTFLMYNSGFSALRKGFLEVINAFRYAFGDSDKVRLIIKSARPDLEKRMFADAWKNIDNDNIILIAEEYTRKQLMELLGHADMFVFPSRGEGWGHTPLEAMATGLNCIIPNAHGISDYFYEGVNLSYDTEEHKAQFDREGDFGTWPVARRESLAQAMMFAYMRPELMRDRGYECAEWAKQWNYDKTAKQLLSLI